MQYSALLLEVKVLTLGSRGAAYEVLVFIGQASCGAWPSGPLETREGLEQWRFLETGRQVLCVEVQSKGRQFWELNNPSDVPVIEAMMAEMG